MLSMSPGIAKFVAFGLAIAAIVGSAFVTGTGHDALLSIAFLLIGKEGFQRTGDARVAGVHPDDIRG
jgi:hypothetical protein